MHVPFYKRILSGKALQTKFLIVQAVTISRIPFALLFFILIESIYYNNINYIICLIMLSLIEISDLFDGILARRYAVVNEFGAMLDPFADSISRIFIYWALSKAHLVLLFVPFTMAIRDITVANCRIVSSRYGHSVSANWSGKIKAGFQGVGAFVFILGPLYWKWTGKWTIIAGSWLIAIVTFISMIEYIYDAVKCVVNDRRK